MDILSRETGNFFVQYFDTMTADSLATQGTRSSSETHYCDVIMGVIASQITSITIVYSTVYSDADQRKHQNSASLAFVWGIHWGPVNSPHKWPVTRKMFSFDDVIMGIGLFLPEYSRRSTGKPDYIFLNFDFHCVGKCFFLYTGRYVNITVTS